MGDLVQLPLKPRPLCIEPVDMECMKAWAHLQNAIMAHWEQKTAHSEWKLKRAMQLYIAVVRK